MVNLPANEVKVSDLISITDAAATLGWSWWKAKRALDSGKLQGIMLPHGGRAVLRSSVERLAKQQVRR